MAFIGKKLLEKLSVYCFLISYRNVNYLQNQPKKRDMFKKVAVRDIMKAEN